MTLLDRMMAAVTPMPSPEQRELARRTALGRAGGCAWLSHVMRQHAAIEDALHAVARAHDPAHRRRALRWLATLLTGHSLAEQAVLYPAIVDDRRRAHAVCAYADESNVKMELAALERIDPAAPDFVDKLELLRADLMQHLVEEEATWYPPLCRNLDEAQHERLSARFLDEFRRYMGCDAELV